MSTPILSISPIYKSFGIQAKDSDTSQIVRISNIGDDILGIETVTGISGSFSMVDNFSNATLDALIAGNTNYAEPTAGILSINSLVPGTAPNSYTVELIDSLAHASPASANTHTTGAGVIHVASLITGSAPNSYTVEFANTGSVSITWDSDGGTLSIGIQEGVSTVSQVLSAIPTGTPWATLTSVTNGVLTAYPPTAMSALPSYIAGVDDGEGHEIVTWTPTTLSITIEAGMTTVSDIQGPGGGVIGTPWGTIGIVTSGDLCPVAIPPTAISDLPNYSSGVDPIIQSVDSTVSYSPSSFNTGESCTLIIPSNDPASPTIWTMDGTCQSQGTINTFSSNPIRDGSVVLSYINKDSLVLKIQTDNPDVYFDSTDKIGKVYIYYTHQDGRQEKRIVHNQDGTNLIGPAEWTSYAKDGTWEMTRVRTFDHDGAFHDMGRASIGTIQDIVIS